VRSGTDGSLFVVSTGGSMPGIAEVSLSVGRGRGSGILPAGCGDSIAVRRVRSGMPVGGGACIVGSGTGGASLFAASAGSSIPGRIGVSLSVGQGGVKDTVGKGELWGTLISSEATGFTAGAGGRWLSISIAFGATEGGRRGLAACPSRLVGRPFTLSMIGVSWASSKVRGFGGAATIAGTLT
jgi:hypothetical protein